MNFNDIGLGQSFIVLEKAKDKRAWKMPRLKKDWEEAPDWVKKIGQDKLIEPIMTDHDELIFTIIARKSRHSDDFWACYPGDFLVEGELLPIRKHEIELFYDFNGGNDENSK